MYLKNKSSFIGYRLIAKILFLPGKTLRDFLNIFIPRVKTNLFYCSCSFL